MVNWQQVDVVLLDMDGTLLDLHFDNFFWQRYLPAAYAQRHDLDPGRAEQKLNALFAVWHGTLQWYSLDFWREALDIDILALKQQIRDRIAVRPGALAFLEFLGRQAKRRILVTNAHPDSLNLKMAETGLARSLDRLYSSHALGYPKEEHRFWQRLQEVEPFDPARALFIDDTPSILESARDYGIGQVLGVLRPDSQGPERPYLGFERLASFSDLMGMTADD